MPSGLDLDKLRHRFLQFGGWSLLWQYAKMGVLWCGIKALIRCVVSGVSVKTAYPSIIQGVEEILAKRYRPILDKRLHEQAGAEGGTIQNGVPRIVWCAWLQGIEQAPALVKSLYRFTKTGFTRLRISVHRQRELSAMDIASSSCGGQVL